MPWPRADGSTSKSRSFAASSDPRTRNTEPTGTPSISAIPARFAGPIEIAQEARGDFGDPRLERNVPAIFLRVQRAGKIVD
jgi:hypothetical protein